MSLRPCLPCCRRNCETAGPLRSAGVTPLPRYYGPIRHPLAFGRLPGVSGYTAYLAPAVSRRDEEGFSSCLACPCPRAAATTPPEWMHRLNQVSTLHAAFTLRLQARPLGFSLSGPPVRLLSLRPDNSLTIPRMAFSMGFRSSVSLRPAIQATGFWFLPRQDCLLLNTPAFPGHTTVRERDCVPEACPQPASSSVLFYADFLRRTGGDGPWVPGLLARTLRRYVPTTPSRLCSSSGLRRGA